MSSRVCDRLAAVLRIPHVTSQAVVAIADANETQVLEAEDVRAYGLRQERSHWQNFSHVGMTGRTRPGAS